MFNLIDTLNNDNPEWMDIIKHELKIESPLRLCETFNDRDSDKYCLIKAGSLKYFIFDSIESAAYYTAENYIYDGIQNELMGIIKSLTDKDLKAKLKALFSDYILNSIKPALDQIKGISDSPYGYLVTNEDLAKDEIIKYTQAVNFVRITLKEYVTRDIFVLVLN